MRRHLAASSPAILLVLALLCVSGSTRGAGGRSDMLCYSTRRVLYSVLLLYCKYDGRLCCCHVQVLLHLRGNAWVSMVERQCRLPLIQFNLSRGSPTRFLHGGLPDSDR